MVTLQDVLERREMIDSMYSMNSDMLKYIAIIVIILLFHIGVCWFRLFDTKTTEGKYMAAALSVLGCTTAVFLTFVLHVEIVQNSKEYEDWRIRYVKPYIESLEQRYDIVGIGILGPSHEQNNSNHIFAQDQLQEVRLSISENGRVMTYILNAEIYIAKGVEKPYVILHRLEERLDQRFPPGIYDVAVYIPEN